MHVQWIGVSICHNECNYPSPTLRVGEDTLVGVCVSVLALNRLIANFN